MRLRPFLGRAVQCPIMSLKETSNSSEDHRPQRCPFCSLHLQLHCSLSPGPSHFLSPNSSPGIQCFPCLSQVLIYRPLPKYGTPGHPQPRTIPSLFLDFLHSHVSSPNIVHHLPFMLLWVLSCLFQLECILYKGRYFISLIIDHP